MVAQISTAVSDAVLALVSLHTAQAVFETSLPAFTGFLLVGVAASAGVLRFRSPSPGRFLLNTHEFLSWTATVLGISCLAAAYHRVYLNVITANIHLALALAMCLLRGSLEERPLSICTEAVSSGAIVSILILSAFYNNPYAIIGSVAYALAGLLIGVKGHIYSVLRVDVFHYILAVANVSLMIGLMRPQSLVYYRPTTMGS